jgi:hypothetical protein
MLKRYGGFVFDDSQFPKPGDEDFVPRTEDEFWAHGTLLQRKRQQGRERDGYKTTKPSEVRRVRSSGKLDKNLDRSPDYY